MQNEPRFCINIQSRHPFSGVFFPGFPNKPGLFLGPSGPFRGTARAAKVTTFYKIGPFSALFAAISGSGEDGFQGRRDGLFCARDGHYVSNDHREPKNDGFRVVRKSAFSPPPPPRRAYRQTTEGRKAPDRCRNGRNVYLYIIRKIITTQNSRTRTVAHSFRKSGPHAGALFCLFYPEVLFYPVTLFLRQRAGAQAPTGLQKQEKTAASPVFSALTRPFVVINC